MSVDTEWAGISDSILGEVWRLEEALSCPVGLWQQSCRVQEGNGPRDPILTHACPLADCNQGRAAEALNRRTDVSSEKLCVPGLLYLFLHWFLIINVCSGLTLPIYYLKRVRFRANVQTCVSWNTKHTDGKMTPCGHLLRIDPSLKTWSRTGEQSLAVAFDNNSLQHWLRVTSGKGWVTS